MPPVEQVQPQAEPQTQYPATLNIDYPEKLERLSTFFRILWAIPAFAIYSILTGSDYTSYVNEAGQKMSNSGDGVTGAIFLAVMLMILFRRRYPRWWFDFSLELYRFSSRLGAYLFLLTDKYPSTVEAQSVHIDIDYPDAATLNRWLPLVKWLLAIPHYIVLIVLAIAAGGVIVIAWFAIMFTGKYPKTLFDFVVGVLRWSARVNAYAFLLVTDKYPPFSLE